MEFVDSLDGPIDESVADGSDQYVRSLRQRIIAAQIRDSEVGLEEMTLTGGENFESSVENKVSSNESVLIEMDEIITQIRQWRNTISDPAMEGDEDGCAAWTENITSSDGKVVTDPTAEAPESEEDHDPLLPAYDIDAYMAAKLKSLQDLIKESKSAVSRAAHEKHIQEYSALVQQLQTRFGIELGTLGDEDSDSSDTEGDSGLLAQMEGGNYRHRNNNVEEQILSGSESAAIALQQRRLETDFEAIDVEVKQSITDTLRAKEDEVIRDSADLQQGLWDLQDSLLDFTGDLDRLLQS